MFAHNCNIITWLAIQVYRYALAYNLRVHMHSKEVLEKAGVLPVEEYIQRRRDTILPYARSTNIYERCKNAKKLDSNLLWWEVNYYSSNDAAEVREDQAVNGF